MRGQRNRKSDERGGTLIEFAVVASIFFIMLIAICAGSNLYFTHNALVEATSRGARYAATQASHSTPGTITTTGGSCSAPSPPCDSSGPRLTQIRNYTIYGNEAGTGSNLLNLQPANVCVQYCQFGVGTGSVSVSVTGYTYNFVVPGIERQITMPAYRSTATGESAGTNP
jgi:Flp pilus assembly protein TadG